MKNIIIANLRKVAAKRSTFKKIAVIAFSLAICVAAIRTIKPVYVPDTAAKEREEMSSFYRQQELDSAHEQAKKEYDEAERERDKRINDEVASIWQAEYEEEIKKAAYYYFDDTSSETYEDNSSSDSEEVTEETKTVDFTPNFTGWSEQDITILVLAVQHEVGKTPGYFPYCDDFDTLQRCMARVIVNRIGTPGFGNNLYDVLNQKNQFTGLLEDVSHYWELPNANQYDPYDERTRANVMAVLNGTDGISHDLYFERCSLRSQSSITEAWEYVKTLFASPNLKLEHYEETGDGRFLMFISNPTGAY